MEAPFKPGDTVVLKAQDPYTTRVMMTVEFITLERHKETNEEYYQVECAYWNPNTKKFEKSIFNSSAVMTPTKHNTSFF